MIGRMDFLLPGTRGEALAGNPCRCTGYAGWGG